MFVKDLEKPDVQRDLAAALKRAAADVPALEEAHKAAADRVERCESERLRLTRIFAALNTDLKLIREKIATLKRRWLESTIEGKEDVEARKEYLTIRAQRDGLADQLQFLVEFSTADNRREAILAEIAEQETDADSIEGRATVQRLGLLSAAAAGAAYDPGASITFRTDDGAESWSAKEAARANDIRNYAVNELKKRLAAHDESVTLARSLVSPRLFS